ncbi:MAG: DUF58 domain-containing protein [Bacillota bacterium]|nr:DUF58 domain-containing protein [Bacillota bacterium]NLV63125.1 DUF58 domain-containing protein [Clostridiaceae bacterium]
MKIIDNDTLKKIQRLAIKTGLKLEGQAAGNRKSLSKGSSVEFSDFREYTAGDDFRRIDWNAYGRFDKLFVKLFMEEREAPVRIFLDTSLSMNYGQPDKNTAAKRLAAALAYISVNTYDRVYINPWNSMMQGTFGPYSTPSSFAKAVNTLEIIENGGKSNFTEAVAKMEWKTGRGISIVITDGLVEGGLEEGLKYLKYMKQDVYLCQILSPQELAPDIDGALELVDIETNDIIEVTVSGELFDMYEKLLKQFLNNIKQQCKKFGIHYALLPSDMALEEMVLKVAS